jgi:hypothetical protein
MKKYIILFLAFILIGCATQKHLAETNHEIQKDSSSHVKVEYVEKEIIKSVPDSALISALLECDSIGQVRLKELLEFKSGKYIKPQIKLVDNRIEIKAVVDSMQIYREFYRKYNREDSLRTVIKDNQRIYEKKADEEVQKTKRYKWIAIILGSSLGLTVIGIIIFLYIKKLIPFTIGKFSGPLK